VKRIKQAGAKIMAVGALSATVVVGAAGIASAFVGPGGVTNGGGSTYQAAFDQAASLCDSGRISSVYDARVTEGEWVVTAYCA
jgi:hypothetical protein